MKHKLIGRISLELAMPRNSPSALVETKGQRSEAKWPTVHYSVKIAYIDLETRKLEGAIT